MSDFVPGYEADSWFGIGTRRGTPPAIITRLNTEINAGLADPGIRTRVAGLGGMVMPGSPVAFAGFIAAESEIEFFAPTITAGTMFDVMFRLVDSEAAPMAELRSGCFTVLVK